MTPHSDRCPILKDCENSARGTHWHWYIIADPHWLASSKVVAYIVFQILTNQCHYLDPGNKFWHILNPSSTIRAIKEEMFIGGGGVLVRQSSPSFWPDQDFWVRPINVFLFFVEYCCPDTILEESPSMLKCHLWVLLIIAQKMCIFAV